MVELTRQEKLILLFNSFKRQGITQNENESNQDYVFRVIDEETKKAKRRFLKQQIMVQYSIENPQQEIDVSDI